MRARGDGVPPPKIWRDKFPIAYIHYQHARILLGAISESLKIPVENLISPDLVRRITFNEGRELIYREENERKLIVESALTGGNARPWQIRLTLDPLTSALANTEPPIVTEEPLSEE